MKFYLQTLNPDEFSQINQAVTLSGIITEPCDFSRGELDVRECLENLLEMMSEDQHVFVYGLSTGFRTMLEEGKRLQQVSKQIVLTLPANEQGLMAMKAAKRMNLPVAAGCVFQSEQALMAMQNHAGTVFLDMEKIGRFSNPENVLQEVNLRLASYKETEVIVIAKTLDQLRLALECGSNSICSTPEVYGQMLFNVLTTSEMAQAREEWLMAYTRNEVLE